MIKIIILIGLIVFSFVLGFYTSSIVAFKSYYCGEIHIDKSGDRDKYRFEMHYFPEKKYSIFINKETKLDDGVVIPQ